MLRSLLPGAACLLALGCGTAVPPTPAPAPTEDHAHKPGAHGGTLLSLGRDSYHAEAVFEKDGTVRLYLLGKDEARVQETDAQPLAGYVTPDGATEAEPITFRPEPQPGDAAGKTSRFAATLPPALAGKKVNVTVNNFAVNGERFRVAFSNTTAAADMPAKKGTAEEQAIFLSPGGKYTAADIAANGTTVPTEKFKGIRASHDDDPKPGDKLCPISKTKANPAFVWVVGGKRYEFCCVPCAEEFVALAKEKPAEVKDPGEYVKK